MRNWLWSAIGVFSLLAFYFVFLERWVPESADWYGRTGLSADVERELPKYLRREFGESWLSSRYLKASDLKYVGAFDEGKERVHYWTIPWDKEEIFASVVVGPRGERLGWGARKPPTREAK